MQNELLHILIFFFVSKENCRPNKQYFTPSLIQEISQFDIITSKNVQSHDEGLSYDSRKYNLLIKKINVMLYKDITPE